MKFSKLSKKQKTMAILALSGTLLIGAVGSMSYFSDKETITNNFTTGVLDLKTTETYWDPEGEPGPDGQEDGKNTYPGYTRYKNPTVTNISGIENNDSWIRATVTFIDAKTNQQITDTRRNELILNTIRYDAEGTMDENTETAGGYTNEQINAVPHWNPAFKDMTETKGSSGKYVLYLNEVLKSAATAEDGEAVTLFTTIAYPTEWNQTELDIMGDYRIQVEFSGIQKWTFENVDEAMEALYAEEAAGTDHKGYDRVSSGGNKENPNGDNTPSKMEDPERDGETDMDGDDDANGEDNENDSNDGNSDIENNDGNSDTDTENENVTTPGEDDGTADNENTESEGGASVSTDRINGVVVPAAK